MVVVGLPLASCIVTRDNPSTISVVIIAVGWPWEFVNVMVVRVSPNFAVIVVGWCPSPPPSIMVVMADPGPFFIAVGKLELPGLTPAARVSTSISGGSARLGVGWGVGHGVPLRPPSVPPTSQCVVMASGYLNIASRYSKDVVIHSIQQWGSKKTNAGPSHVARQKPPFLLAR
jgi:hypothetical protein